MDRISTLIMKGSLMNIYEQRLRAYLEEQHIQAEHLSFDQPCHSVAEAARAVDASPEELVKNICLLDSDGQLITAIVKGEDRVSISRIAKTLQIAVILTPSTLPSASIAAQPMSMKLPAP